MAEDITIRLTEEIVKALAEVAEEMRVTKESVSEERIRGIVREELQKWEKSFLLLIKSKEGSL